MVSIVPGVLPGSKGPLYYPPDQLLILWGSCRRGIEGPVLVKTYSVQEVNMQTVNQGNRFLTTCPSCNRRWKIADGYEDSPVICPLCGSKFVARRALEGQEPPPGK